MIWTKILNFNSYSVFWDGIKISELKSYFNMLVKYHILYLTA